MDKSRIITLNVNGLRNDSKRRQVFHYLNTKSPDIVFLQETHSELVDEKKWSAEFGTRIWFDHGNRSSKGVGTSYLFLRDVRKQLWYIM